MIKGQEINLALGEPIYIEGFNDGVMRLCYPFTLKRLTIANLYLSGFDHENLYNNFRDQSAMMAMTAFLKEAFRPKDNDEAMNTLHAIDKDNFAEIVCDIKRVSGISDAEKGDIDIPKTTNSMDWNVALNSIPIYTSTPHSAVGDLTLTQLQNTLNLIGKKINWEYKAETIGLVKKPNEYLKEREHPLYSEPSGNGKKHITMDDVQGLMKMK